MLLKNEKMFKLNDGPVDIRAVLSKRHYNLLINNKASLEVPEGVSMKNKAGSKVLSFHCDSRDVAEVLCDGLDVSGIPWDETV
jgi:hypothetical protein